jgi:hypothetical protein
MPVVTGTVIRAIIEYPGLGLGYGQSQSGLVHALVSTASTQNETWQVLFPLNPGETLFTILDIPIQFIPKNDGTGTFVSR